MAADNTGIKGLTEAEVRAARVAFGENKLRFKKENGFTDVIIHLAKEPMVILLLLASSIYFISGETGDGIFLAVAILFTASISLYQDSRSRNALQKLNDLTQPFCKVMRDGKVSEIKSEELVVGDHLIVEEGASITADGTIIRSNDFSVNESILTGESLPVMKDSTCADHFIYNGTVVSTGTAIAKITAIGNQTRLGKIGSSLEKIKEEKTPLEIQIKSFVRKLAISGLVVFVGVWVINYIRSSDLLNSLLQSLTLAMSILPEEIPVAFTTFMALGAWRLMKMGIVVKQMKTVETLGSATVICVDKTGTITENKMSLAKLYILSSDQIVEADKDKTRDIDGLLTAAMWASEPSPFDPMEIALHQAYAENVSPDERKNYKMVHEYPLGGKPPMMTHVFKNSDGQRIIAAKGAPEAMIKVSGLDEAGKNRVVSAIKTLAGEGYRVLGVGVSEFEGEKFPEKQQDLPFRLLGLVAFYDPPKKNIRSVFSSFYSAGISVKIITGDNAATTQAIAAQVGFHDPGRSISGDELMALNEDELRLKVKDITIFTRMFPEAKLRIVNALKFNQQIVAMTGDGVNDGPALKAAHIGIAMGKRGTEIARQAASLILLEDDLSAMVHAVAMGRKIYANLKKAIQYIISIHIPIILTVFLPLALGWIYPNIFSPIHIIFLEIIMGPTCSIIYENEPLEKNTMLQKPKIFTRTFFSWNELATSVLQGLVITAAVLLIYRYSVTAGYGEDLTRTMCFTVLITANIFLTLVNRSFYYSALTTLKYPNKLVPLIIFITTTLTAAILYLQPVTSFFRFKSPDLAQLAICFIAGCLSVSWYELVKLVKRQSRSEQTESGMNAAKKT